jgi:hypothetical protein
VHQVGPNDSRSYNFSFLAFKTEVVGEVQILRTATARDRPEKIIAKIMLFIHIPYVASKNTIFRVEKQFSGDLMMPFLKRGFLCIFLNTFFASFIVSLKTRELKFCIDIRYYCMQVQSFSFARFQFF